MSLAPKFLWVLDPLDNLWVHLVCTSIKWKHWSDFVCSYWWMSCEWVYCVMIPQILLCCINEHWFLFVLVFICLVETKIIIKKGYVKELSGLPLTRRLKEFIISFRDMYNLRDMFRSFLKCAISLLYSEKRFCEVNHLLKTRLECTLPSTIISRMS